jgi:hypothetical protein
MASEEDFLASSIIGRNVHVICAEENREAVAAKSIDFSAS